MHASSVVSKDVKAASADQEVMEEVISVEVDINNVAAIAMAQAPTAAAAHTAEDTDSKTRATHPATVLQLAALSPHKPLSHNNRPWTPCNTRHGVSTTLSTRTRTLAPSTAVLRLYGARMSTSQLSSRTTLAVRNRHRRMDTRLHRKMLFHHLLLLRRRAAMLRTLASPLRLPHLPQAAWVPCLLRLDSKLPVLQFSLSLALDYSLRLRIFLAEGGSRRTGGALRVLIVFLRRRGCLAG